MTQTAKDQKYQAYDDYLHEIDDEALTYEYGDRIGHLETEDRETLISELLSWFGLLMLDNLEWRV